MEEARYELRVVILRLDPLGGEIGPADGELRSFSGWIGLAAAINDCLAQPPRPTDPELRE